MAACDDKIAIYAAALQVSGLDIHMLARKILNLKSFTDLNA